MKKGKLIVIDGTDGSGKATQTQLLVKRMRREGRKVSYIDFPRYGQASAAMLESYLRGEFGTAQEVGPYRASVLYAFDRYAASFDIKRWLDQGYTVIADRYVSSNMGHQSGKIKNAAERRKFLKWLENLEFKIFGIPKPDLILLLYMPPIVSRRLVDKRGQKQDIHEKDRRHIAEAARAYLGLAKQYRWPVIECAPRGKLLSILEVHDLVWAKVRNLLR